MVAKELDIIPKDKWNFLWITEMPFFEQDEETGEWIAMHHPFTMPMEECLPYLDTDKARVRAKALTWFSTALSCPPVPCVSRLQLQNKMFELLGLSKEEIDAKFGFLVEAYQYAAPPHGGYGALGWSRLGYAHLRCRLPAGCDRIPQVQNASELMSGCPAEIDAVQLEELGMPLPEADA